MRGARWLQGQTWVLNKTVLVGGNPCDQLIDLEGPLHPSSIF